MRPFVPLACATLLLAHPARCQQAPPLEPGARIRLDSPRLGRVTGTLAEWESDTLLVNVDGDAEGLVQIIPVDSLRRIQVRGQRDLFLEGAGAGVLGGALLAVIASPDLVDEDGNCTIGCVAYKVSPNMETRIEVLSVAGLFLGAILGATTKTDAWVTVVPTRDHGVAVGVRLSF